MILSIESATHIPGGSPHDPKWECDAWVLTLRAVDEPGDTGTTSHERRMNVMFYCGTGQRKVSRTNRPPGGARAGAVKVRRARWTPADLGHDRTKWPHGSDPGWMYASPPTIGDVLECLCADATLVEDAHDWASWADELGFFSADSVSAADVRRSQATHAASIAQTDELRRLLAGSYQTAVYHGPEDGWSSSDGDTITITRAEATTA